MTGSEMSGEARQPVALVLGYTWLAISTPPIMTALYLADRGHPVDIFVDPDPDFTGRLGINIPQLDHPLITIRPTPPAEGAGPVFLADGTPLPAGQRPFATAWRSPPRRYGWIVGFDPAGLVRATLLSQRWGVPYVYHSLEFAPPEDPLKPLERACNRGALYTLSQDEARGLALAKLNELDPGSVFAVRNSSIGPVLPEKSDFFRERFPIGDRLIVLGVGTLSPAHSVDKLLASAASFPDDFVLVLHGWFNEDWFGPVAKAVADRSDRIFISTAVVPPGEKLRVFQGADVGVVSFEPLDCNMLNGAASAGKYYDFLRCGVPVVGNGLPGMRELVEGDGCGLVVEDASLVHQALPAIMGGYDAFRASCLAAFPRYEFSACYAPVLEMTRAMIRRGA